MPEPVTIFDHLRVPAGRRPRDADISILACPRQAVRRLRIAESIALRRVGAIAGDLPVGIEHLVSAVRHEDARTTDRLVDGFVVDTNSSGSPPPETIRGFGILDVIARLGTTVDRFPAGARRIPHAPQIAVPQDARGRIEIRLVDIPVTDRAG